MQKFTRVLPDRGYAVVADGLVKTEFETQEGATKGARALKGRFPALQIKIYMLARSLIKRWFCHSRFERQNSQMRGWRYSLWEAKAGAKAWESQKALMNLKCTLVFSEAL